MSSPAERGETAPPSFARNLARTLPFMLVCGIGGPILIVVHFATETGLTGWTLWAGLAVTLLALVLAALLAARRTNAQRRTYRLRQTGRRAVAEVVSAQKTGVLMNDQPLFDLHLRIQGADIAAFDAEGRCAIFGERMQLLHARRLPVIVDPETREWEFDWDAAL